MIKTRIEIQCPHLRGTVEHKVSCLAGLWHLSCYECTHPDKNVLDIREDLNKYELRIAVNNYDNRN